MRAAALTACLLAVVVAIRPVSAQPGRSGLDDQIVRHSTLVVSGAHVEIFRHDVEVDAAFLTMAEEAYRQLEVLTGRKLDTATLGPRVRIYVSGVVRFSHRAELIRLAGM